MWSICSWMDLERMTASFKYVSTNCHFTVDSIISITHWNVLGAFFRPNHRDLNLYSPWCDVNAVASCPILQSKSASTRS